ncbi:hypothetical protein VDIAB_250311 [Vibrio diabolicus]|nr:hypothetical protein VDIAB_250311 [Vibrio diabolicus]
MLLNDILLFLLAFMCKSRFGFEIQIAVFIYVLLYSVRKEIADSQ